MAVSATVSWSATPKIYRISVSVLNIKNLSICCRHKYNQSISRISEHICGRKWWLSVRQYRDQRHQKCFTRPVGPSLWPLSSTRSDQPSKKVSSKIVKWLQSRTALCDLTRKIVRKYTRAKIRQIIKCSKLRSARLGGLYYQQDPTNLEKR